jgi:fused signal recognition particle receptor
MLGWFKKKKKAAPEQKIEHIVQEPLAEEPEQVDSKPDAPVIEPPQNTPSDPQEVSDFHADPPAALANESFPPEPPEPPVQTSKTENVENQDFSAQQKPASLLKRLSQRLSRTRESFTSRIDELFLGQKEINAELFDELEEILITADLGVATTQDLLERARKQVKRDGLSDPLTLKQIIKEQLKAYISSHGKPVELSLPDDGPFIIMVIGVNGVGKTTTIGKIARKFLQADQSVLLVAADTFRAAATSQLKIWGERNGIRVIAQQEGADPSSVVFDAMDVAISNNYDVVLVDTAGRLHTKVNLMEELKKIKRVMNKKLEGAPHEILLVIDATTGQNGISQATLFNEAVGVSGIALTKLDGTAKGGIVANITKELDLPIRFIGVGEQVDDLRDFDADEFIEALFTSESDLS